MSGLASLKKHWYWAGLVVLSALIATAALVAPGKISRYELEREAFTAAQRLRVQMLNEPDTLFYALSSPSFTTQFAEILDKWGYSHRVLRYELYDQNGGLDLHQWALRAEARRRVRHSAGETLKRSAVDRAL